MDGLQLQRLKPLACQELKLFAEYGHNHVFGQQELCLVVQALYAVRDEDCKNSWKALVFFTV